MRKNLHVRRFVHLLCGVLLAVSFLLVSTSRVQAGVTPQIDSAPYTPTYSYVDSGGTRTYTIHNLLLNDDPYILRTDYGTESFESLHERNKLAFEANVHTMVDAIKGMKTQSKYQKHTGWFASVRINNTLYEDFTENGYIGEKYTIKEVSEAYNKYKSKFPKDLVAKIATISQSDKIFKVVNDSRDKRDTKYRILGGYAFIATTSKHAPLYKAGDKIFIQYKDNYVFVDVDVLVTLPSTCPDGSPKPPNGECGGTTGGGGGGGTTQKCPDGSPLPASGKLADCTTGGGGTTPPCTDCGGGGDEPDPPPPDTDPECHPTALGTYPNCYAGDINLTEEIDVEYFPTWGVGEISWGLSKVTKAVTGGSPTQIASTNLLPIGSGHAAERNAQYSQSGVMTGTVGKTTPRNVSASDKGTQTYKVAYEYTNWAKATYKCNAPAEREVTQTHIKDGQEVPYEVTAYDYNNCYESFSEYSGYWDFIDERPDWSKGKSYACSESLAVDHDYGATLSGKNSVSGTYNIGRHANVRGSENGCSITSSQVFTETISHDSEHKDLNTQTYLPFVENPVVWQGNPNYDTTSVMPYVADSTSQGNMGVPELNEVFKK